MFSQFIQCVFLLYTKILLLDKTNFSFIYIHNKTIFFSFGSLFAKKFIWMYYMDVLVFSACSERSINVLSMFMYIFGISENHFTSPYIVYTKGTQCPHIISIIIYSFSCFLPKFSFFSLLTLMCLLYTLKGIQIGG